MPFLCHGNRIEILEIITDQKKNERSKAPRRFWTLFFHSSFFLIFTDSAYKADFFNQSFGLAEIFPWTEKAFAMNACDVSAPTTNWSYFSELRAAMRAEKSCISSVSNEQQHQRRKCKGINIFRYYLKWIYFKRDFDFKLWENGWNCASPYIFQCHLHSIANKYAWICELLNVSVMSSEACWNPCAILSMPISYFPFIHLD